MPGPLNGSSCWIPWGFAICDCLFKRSDDARDSWRLAQDVITLGRNVRKCNVTLWGSHSRLLDRAIINVQAPGDRTNPSVLWLKYNLHINKIVIFAVQFYFLYFFNVNDDHNTFFTSRIRFLLQFNRLRIDTRTVWLRKKSGLHTADEYNRTEPLIVTATNSRYCCLQRQQLVGWLL